VTHDQLRRHLQLRQERAQATDFVRKTIGEVGSRLRSAAAQEIHQEEPEAVLQRIGNRTPDVSIGADAVQTEQRGSGAPELYPEISIRYGDV
jgi:hypothetical protein